MVSESVSGGEVGYDWCCNMIGAPCVNFLEQLLQQSVNENSIFSTPAKGQQNSNDPQSLPLCVTKSVYFSSVGVDAYMHTLGTIVHTSSSMSLMVYNTTNLFAQTLFM